MFPGRGDAWPTAYVVREEETAGGTGSLTPVSPSHRQVHSPPVLTARHTQAGGSTSSLGTTSGSDWWERKSPWAWQWDGVAQDEAKPKHRRRNRRKKRKPAHERLKAGTGELPLGHACDDGDGMRLNETAEDTPSDELHGEPADG